ncbi:MAG: hypothetical protein ABI609_09765 [Acidobacteriota bacterium]
MANEPSISFEEFVKVSTNTSLAVLAQHQKAGGFKVPPKIWVGILIDPWGEHGGPLAGGPGGLAGGAQH